MAEQAATLDLLSGGRLDFGVGKGYRWNEFAGFCVAMEEADARFDEAMEVITNSFVCDEPFSHRGRYWQYDNIVVEPPSATRPHPPFWMGAGSERSVRQVAERGYNLLLGQYDLAEDVVRHVAQFKADVEKRGRRYDPMEVGIARAIHFADTKEELEAAQIRRFQGHVRINNLSRRPDGDDRDRFARDDEEEVRRLCDETAIFGTPDDIAKKLEALRDGGVEYVLINFGGSITRISAVSRARSCPLSPTSQDAGMDRRWPSRRNRRRCHRPTGYERKRHADRGATRKPMTATGSSSSPMSSRRPRSTNCALSPTSSCAGVGAGHGQ